MYYPYLRGRQYELIAIRELVNKNKIGNFIIPIIEPVKISSTLIKTLETFQENNREIIIINNPKVVKFQEVINESKSKYDKFESLIKCENVKIAHILNAKSSDEINNFNNLKKPEYFFIDRNSSAYYSDFDIDPKLFTAIIPDDRHCKRIFPSKIFLDDKYNKRQKNSDYSEIEEFFSDEHLFFSQDKWKGFSDFSIVGSHYSESGFAPRAVAIHITFLNEKNELIIKHFVSDSNDGIEDPANKFYEAVEKFFIWNNDIGRLNTYGANLLNKHYEEQTYPGLGVVKKLCIMNHLELLNNFLEKGLA